jgi:RNA polymerase sigma-70 factor (ECF subfamily)
MRPAATISPYQAAERSDDVNRVLAALQQLPELDRSIVLFRLQEGVSYEEIAQTVGLTIPALKVRLHRARQKLTSLLNTQENHYENHQECSH